MALVPGTADGEGWQGTPTPRPPGGITTYDGRRRGLEVEMPVVGPHSASRLYAVLAAWMLLGAVGFGVAGALVHPALHVVAVVVGVLGVLAAVGSARVRASGTPLRLGLWVWPDGLTAVLPGGAVELAWEDVRAVRQRWTRRAVPGPGAATPTDWIVLETPRWPGGQRAGVRGVPLDTSRLTADRDLVLTLLRHYLDHPADRPELADGRAAARFGLPWTGA